MIPPSESTKADGLEGSASKVGKESKPNLLRVVLFSAFFFFLCMATSKLVPERWYEWLYEKGMAPVTWVLSWNRSELSTTVVDISPLVDSQDHLDRKALTTLVAQLARFEPAGIAIDNDFTVNGQSPLPGQSKLLAYCLKLYDKGMPVAIGVDSPGIPPAERLMLSEYVPLQASLSLGSQIRYDRDHRVIGPHWVPAMHRITRCFDPNKGTPVIESLPSLTTALTKIPDTVSPSEGTLLTSWRKVKIGSVETIEGLADLSYIPLLKRSLLSCNKKGSLAYSPKNELRQDRELSEQISDKYLVLAAISRAQAHDRFDIPGIGRNIQGGLIHASAIQSYSGRMPKEVTDLGTILLDLILCLTLGLLVEVLFSKFGSTSVWRLLKADIVWTIVATLGLYFLGLLCAVIFNIFWYEWLNFGLSQLIAICIKSTYVIAKKRLSRPLGLSTEQNEPNT